ncbi:hypothetical protein [uncultured Nostoc sp.]
MKPIAALQLGLFPTRFYEFNEQEIILYAVFHCSQDPEECCSPLQ